MYAQNLSAFGVPGPQGFKAIDVRDISLNRIDVGPRQRPLDRKKVEELAKSIMEHGQKQPIAVRNKPGGGCELIFGYHRLEAMKLIDREGLDKRQSIWASIYPEDYPEIRIQLDEIVENLHRNDLTPAEKDAHQTMYAGLSKKLNKVSSAKESRSKNAKNRYSKEDKEANNALQNNIGDPQAVGDLPTITAKLAADLGVSQETVRRRHQNAQNLAARVGVIMPSLEKATADELMEGAQAAALAAQEKKEKAEALGVPESRVDPVRYRTPTVSHFELDVLELPAEFVNWCRRRLKDKQKPITLEMLKATHQALGDLIQEISTK